MSQHKINLSFDCFALRRLQIASVIRTCILATLNAQGVDVPCEINVLITDDSGIRAINSASRNIDKATDVLSFPMFTFQPGMLPDDWTEYLDAESGMCPLGDMAISLERAVKQASAYGHSLRREVGYLTIHSMLHLLGYDHMDDGPQKAVMRGREEQIAAGIRHMRRV